VVFPGSIAGVLGLQDRAHFLPALAVCAGQSPSSWVCLFRSNFPVIGFGVVADHLGILVALIGYATFFGLLLTGSGCYAILKRSAPP